MISINDETKTQTANNEDDDYDDDGRLFFFFFFSLAKMFFDGRMIFLYHVACA